MKKKVLVAVLNQGNIRIELAHHLKHWVLQNKYDLTISYPCMKPIAHNRNSIVQDFLQSPVYDYLVMIDGDNVPPLNFLNLIDFQKDVLGALCFCYQQNMIAPLALERKSDGMYRPIDLYGKSGMVECDAVGTGCIILSRKVLEAVRKPFMNIYDADGIKLWGLDIEFCKRAKEKGFKVYCHLDYPCDHWATVNLRLIYRALADLSDHKDAEQKKEDLCSGHKEPGRGVEEVREKN